MNPEQKTLLLRLQPAQRAALKEAAQAMGLTESAYLRRALQMALRLDAFAEEPIAYQNWLRDGLSDLFAAAQASAVLSHAILSHLLASSAAGGREGEGEELSYLLSQAREAIPSLDTAIPWHSAAAIEGPEFAEFWTQVQGRPGSGSKHRPRKKG